MREQEDDVEYFDDGICFADERIDMYFFVYFVVKICHIQQLYQDNKPQVFGCTKGDDIATDEENKEEYVKD